MSQSVDNNRDYYVLVAVRDQSELGPLLALGCALARAHSGRVTLLSVTPKGERPDWLIAPAVRNDVPVNVLVRVGRHAGGAILAAVRENPPDLLLLGWKGTPGRGQYLLGSTLDPLVRKAPSDVAVVRLRDSGSTEPSGRADSTHQPSFAPVRNAGGRAAPGELVEGSGRGIAGVVPDLGVDTLADVRRVLIPIAGGANAVLAVDLALDLSPDVQVTALNVARTGQGRAGVELGRERLATTLAPWTEQERVQPKVVQAPGIVEGILNEARNGYDLVLSSRMVRPRCSL